MPAESCRPRHAVEAYVKALAFCLAVGTVVVAATPSVAQSTLVRDEDKTLHEAQNPIATRISVPFQSNTYLNAGQAEKTSNVLIIEPVIPIRLTPKWNVISRWVTRIYLPRVSSFNQGSEFGLGNLQPEFYFAPVQAGKVVWGAGPRLYLPTATSDALGINRMGGGPAATVLAKSGPWNAGILANNVWAGSGNERVNQMTLSPFVHFNLQHGWYFVSTPVITANWVAASRDRWTVPVGGGVGHLFKNDNQAVNARLEGFYHAARPDFAAAWQLQVQVQLLFAIKQGLHHS